MLHEQMTTYEHLSFDHNVQRRFHILLNVQHELQIDEQKMDSSRKKNFSSRFFDQSQANLNRMKIFFIIVQFDWILINVFLRFFIVTFIPAEEGKEDRHT